MPAIGCNGVSCCYVPYLCNKSVCAAIVAIVCNPSRVLGRPGDCIPDASGMMDDHIQASGGIPRLYRSISAPRSNALSVRRPTDSPYGFTMASIGKNVPHGICVPHANRYINGTGGNLAAIRRPRDRLHLVTMPAQ